MAAWYSMANGDMACLYGFVCVMNVLLFLVTSAVPVANPIVSAFFCF